MPTAACYFCSLPDDSIQVICEARCLLCSRCQVVPVIRRLLVDNTEFSPVLQTSGTFSNNFVGATILGSASLYVENVNLASSHGGGGGGGGFQMHAVRGQCPLCESALSASMLSLIQTYWEAFRQQVDEEAAGKSSALIELEEISPLIPSFLKRFRSVYEQGEPLEADSESTVPMIKPPIKAKPPSNSAETVDLIAQTKTNLGTVLEFVLDCYCAQWQSILRSGHDSMLTIMMKVSQKKKMSQKTNDYKTKALLDFLSSSHAMEHAELVLFNHLIGLQPKSTVKISPAWSHIATKLLVIAHCDKCLRHAVIHDAAGNPSVTELRGKLARSLTTTAPVTKMVSLKKILRMLKLLLSTREVYWCMLPLTSACVELDTPLPWSETSLAKTVNVLLFVLASSAGLGGMAGTTPDAIAAGPSSSPTPIFPTSLPSPSPSPSPTPFPSKRNSIVSVMGSPADVSVLTPPLSHGVTHPKRGNVPSRVDVLRSLDVCIEKVWSSTQAYPVHLDASSSSPPPSSPASLPVLTSLDSVLRTLAQVDVTGHTSSQDNNNNNHHDDDDGDKKKKDTAFHVQLGLDTALRYLEGPGAASCSTWQLPLPDAVFVLIRCWECEYHAIKRHLQRGSVTVQRRDALLGIYDPSHAQLTAADKLCLMRLLHYYSHHGELRGIDWDDVLRWATPKEENDEDDHNKDAPKGKDGRPPLAPPRSTFPFAIPASLLSKSRNELNYLSEKVARMLDEQREQDELEDIRSRGRTLVHAYGQSAAENYAERILALYGPDEELAHGGGRGGGRGQDGLFPPSSSSSLGVVKHVDQVDSTGRRRRLSMEMTPHQLQASLAGGLQGSLARHLRSASQMFSPEAFQHFHDEVSGQLQALGTAAKGGETSSGLSSIRRPPSGGSLRPTQSTPAMQTSTVPTVLSSHTTDRASGGNSSTMSYSLTDEVQRRKVGEKTTQHRPRPQQPTSLTLVDLLDNDGDVLSNAHYLSLSRPLSGKHLHQEDVGRPAPRRRGDERAPPSSSLSSSSIFLPSALEHTKQPLEHDVETFLPIGAYSGMARKHQSKGHYRIYLEQGVDSDGKPILQVHVDDTSFLTHHEVFDEVVTQHDASLQHTAEVGEDYRLAVQLAKHKRQQTVRSRILARALEEGTLSASEFDDHMSALRITTSSSSLSATAKSRALLPQVSSAATGLPRGESFDSCSSTSTATPNGLVMPYLYLTPYIDSMGRLTLDVNNNLYAESAVFYLDIQQSYITAATLRVVLETFCKEKQMETLRVLDLSYNPHLGYPATKLLHRTLRQMCRLIHINLNDLRMGEGGLKMLLEGMLHGGGAAWLQRLDLQNNNISIAASGFEYLQHFHQLKMLDLAKNQFTLDTGYQLRRFTAGLSGLVSLTALSVAHNKIQDAGFAALVDVFLYTDLADRAARDKRRGEGWRATRGAGSLLDEEDEDDDEEDEEDVIQNNRVSFLAPDEEGLASPSHSSRRPSRESPPTACARLPSPPLASPRFQLRYLDVCGCFLTSTSRAKLVQLYEASAQASSLPLLVSNKTSSVPPGTESSGLAGNPSPAAGAPVVKRQESSLSQRLLPSLVLPERPAVSSLCPATPGGKGGTPLSMGGGKVPGGGGTAGTASAASVSTPVAVHPTRRKSSVGFGQSLSLSVRIEPGAAPSASVGGGGEVSTQPVLPSSSSSTRPGNVLPLEKVYLVGNLLSSVSMYEMQEKYEGSSRLRLVWKEDGDVVGDLPAALSSTGAKKIKHSLQQRKYLTDVDMTSFSRIHDLDCYDLQAYGIVKNRDMPRLI